MQHDDEAADLPPELQWQLDAACRHSAEGPAEDLVPFFEAATLTATSVAKSLCGDCRVRIDCAQSALRGEEHWWIWGGLTPSERRHLLRTRPGVTKCCHTLEVAIAEYDLVAVTFEQDFSALFEREFHRLVGFLITTGALRHDAEDSVQMAFVELARHWTEVVEQVGWLRRVAHRMWSKVVMGSRGHELTSEMLGDATVGHGDDTHLLEQHQVLQLLSRLPEQQRAVLAYAYDGATPAETAEALGVPAANVRQNLKRARTTLARILTEEGVAP